MKTKLLLVLALTLALAAGVEAINAWTDHAPAAIADCGNGAC